MLSVAGEAERFPKTSLNRARTVRVPPVVPKLNVTVVDCHREVSTVGASRERGGLSVDTLFFVPMGETAEIQKVTLTNTSSATKTVTLFSFVEFCLWNAQDDQTNYQRNLSTGEVEIDGSTVYHKTEYRERRNHFAFYSVNAPVAGFVALQTATCCAVLVA